MDDVIFAGTAGAPAATWPRSSLTLDDARAPRRRRSTSSRSCRSAAGSSAGRAAFRVNGREARARDVQTLFADLASGARSSAHGQPGPGRRSSTPGRTSAARVLEEAAGITGLHARRHEAELKLRAAEANLARAEDLRTQLDGQLAGLQQQARQANRWRTLATAVKEAEAELLALAQARVEPRARRRRCRHWPQPHAGARRRRRLRGARRGRGRPRGRPPLRAAEARRAPRWSATACCASRLPPPRRGRATRRRPQPHGWRR